MKINMFFKITLRIVIFSLLVVSCRSHRDLSFNDFDKDGDGRIDQEEFIDTYTAYYLKWEGVENGYPDDEGFYSSLYHIWDIDKDKKLNKEEWMMGYNYYYGEFIVKEYESVDADQDGFIEYEDFNDVLRDSDFFASWDRDASDYLDEEELAHGLFAVWDVDNNGYLDADEFDAFELYYLEK
ncbi:MAG: EF-hand domain-containing protein [Bacteroidota bacterium]